MAVDKPFFCHNVWCHIMQRKPNISLAKQKLGWEPQIKLEEGLKKTISYFKSILVNEYQ